MIKAYEFESTELREEIESAVNALDTGDTLVIELDPPGVGPAGLPHGGTHIRVIVLDPDARWQKIIFRVEDDILNSEWVMGTAEDVVASVVQWKSC